MTNFRISKSWIGCFILTREEVYHWTKFAPGNARQRRRKVRQWKRQGFEVVTLRTGDVK